MDEEELLDDDFLDEKDNSEVEEYEQNESQLRSYIEDKVKDKIHQKSQDFIKDKIGKKTTEEATEKAAKKTAETAAKKTAEKAAKETAETAAKKTAETAAKKTAETAAKKTAEVAAKKTAEVAGTNLAGTGTAATANPVGLMILAVIFIVIKILLIIFLIIGVVLFIALFDINTPIEEYNMTYTGNNYNGSSLSYIKELEGTTGTSETEEGDTCSSVELDGFTTIVGPNFTNNHLEAESVNYVIVVNNWFEYFKESKAGSKYILDVRGCIPNEVLDQLIITYIINELEEPLIEVLSDYEVELQIHEIDALVSLAYGNGISHYEPLVEAYKNGGYESLWNVMKDIGIEGSEEERYHQMKRRKSEFALFVTGDYTDSIGNFYEGRGFTTDKDGNQIEMSYEEYAEEYNNYDSEDVTSNIFTGNLPYSTNGILWWPIGSSDEGNGMASGPPSTLEINMEEGLFDDPRLDGPHGGVDLLDYSQEPSGTHLIIAARSGIVDRAASPESDISGGSGWGNYVRIDHGDNTWTIYAHLHPGSLTVTTGQTVTQGQIIGRMGNTGNSFGVHLHFEYYIGGTVRGTHNVDPLLYINPSDPRPTDGSENKKGGEATNEKQE